MSKTQKARPRSQRGYNTNLASEFHAMSVLYRLGLDANLTLGNKKAVDIVVVQSPGKTITIDVKAVAGRVDWLVGNAAGPARKGHFVVLLAYDGKFGQIEYQPKAWVLPHDEFLRLIRAAKAPSIMRYVRRSEVAQLAQRADAWHLLRTNRHL
ncbi:MAG: hypothetical protein HYU37_00725 [Acidobacteria bacterium]|nr:hypothetical protein [Acidobacteriota bacterium]